MDSVILIDPINTLERCDTAFFKNIYNYYYHQGIKNIVIFNVNSLLIKYFLLVFIIFVSSCIDYNAIYTFDKEIDNNDKAVYFSDFIGFNNNKVLNSTYLIICLFLYLIYLICSTINTINTIKNAYKIRKIVNDDLDIKDKQFKYLNWHEIVSKIVSIYPEPNINIYTINSKICMDDNIIINTLRSKIIKTSYITRILEWNYIFCFINTLFYKDNKITQEKINNYNKLVLARLNLILIINVISLPFTIFIVLIYNLISYGEMLYNNPEFFVKRIWSIKSKWRLRYYNELPHEFERRLKAVSNDIDKMYFNYNDKGLIQILNFINFVLSSAFITIIILSLINENILFNCYIYKGRTVIWILGILGTLILVIRKMKNGKTLQKKEKLEILENLKKNLTSINPKWFDLDMYCKGDKFISNMYKSRVIFILLEIVYVILAPYYIYKWKEEFKKKIDDRDFDIDNYINDHYILGKVSKKGIFTNVNEIKGDPHMKASYLEFVKNNPEWSFQSLYFKGNASFDVGHTFNWDEHQNLNELNESQILSSSYIMPNTSNLDLTENKNGSTINI